MKQTTTTTKSLFNFNINEINNKKKEEKLNSKLGIE
jgi:hypothetical protein